MVHRDCSPKSKGPKAEAKGQHVTDHSRLAVRETAEIHPWMRENSGLSEAPRCAPLYMFFDTVTMSGNFSKFNRTTLRLDVVRKTVIPLRVSRVST